MQAPNAALFRQLMLMSCSGIARVSRTLAESLRVHRDREPPAHCEYDYCARLSLAELKANNFRQIKIDAALERLLASYCSK